MKRIPRVCEYCSAVFTSSEYRISQGRGRFCSTQCARIGQHDKPEIRFWENVRKTDYCWIWTASTNRKGYGRFTIGGHSFSAHRYSYHLHYGSVHDGLCVLHKCDNPPCVNPDHLFLGTFAVNNADRAAKGRSASGERHHLVQHPETVEGERNPFSKLTTAQVLEIRHLYAEGKTTQPKLGLLFGVSTSLVNAIILRHSWKHI